MIRIKLPKNMLMLNKDIEIHPAENAAVFVVHLIYKKKQRRHCECIEGRYIHQLLLHDIIMFLQIAV